MLRGFPFPLLGVLALAGCAASSRSVAPASAAAPSPPRAAAFARVEVPRTVVTPEEATSIDELFARARAARARGDLRAAAEGFDRVVRLDPAGPLAAEALYEAGVAWDDAGELARATERFERLAQAFPTGPLAREARVRTLRLLAYLERWQRAGEVADTVLARYGTDLRPFEAVVTHGAKALSLVMAGDDQRAMTHVEKGRAIIERHGLDTAGRVHRDLAQLYFALGEVRRLRGERIVFDPRPADFAAVLEARCQLLLDAQSAYSDAMRAYDAHWSAMAGFRVGELYQRLHQDLMRVARPPAADSPGRVQLFEGAMRLRYSILLTKGLAMMEHVLAMAQRTGERSSWVERAEAAKRALEQARRDEDAALARLPYTRQELQAALDRLAASGHP